MSSDHAADSLVRPGDVLCGGRFEIVAPLGEGGMGAVVRALDRESGADVAIKVLHPHLAREQRFMARFRREADVVSRLDHPHIVRAFATGEEPDGLSWIAMERVDGPSLSQLLRDARAFAPTRAIRFTRQILAAIAAAHSIGVIHRDLKPGNVVVARGAQGEEIAKVVDFGLARLATTKTFEKLTATGQVVGTPAFMSPEQAMGDRIDERTDIYAAGAIACAMLTGAPPFGRGKLVDILPKLLRGDRVPLTESHPELGALARVVERALSEDADARFATAAEMDAALVALDADAQNATLEWRPRVPLETLRLPAATELEPPPKTTLAARTRVAPPPAAAATFPVKPALGRAPWKPWKRLALLAGAVLLAGGAGVWALRHDSSEPRVAVDTTPRALLSDEPPLARAVAVAVAVEPPRVVASGSATVDMDGVVEPAEVAAHRKSHGRPTYPIPRGLSISYTALSPETRECNFFVVQLRDHRAALDECLREVGSSVDAPPYVFDMSTDVVTGSFRARNWHRVTDPRIRRCIQRGVGAAPAPRGCILNDSVSWRVSLSAP